jgi:hypothetical protein
MQGTVMANVHHMTRKYGGLQGTFAEQLEGFADYAKEMADQIFKSVVIQVGASVINLSPVDTGRFLANWQFSIDSVIGASIDATDQIGDETLARFVSEVGPLTYGQTAYIYNNLVYAIPLEYGHSTQSPRGMVRITQARFQEIVQQAIREVSDQ